MHDAWCREPRAGSAAVSSRVKRLEDKIPELQAKLRKHMKHAPAQAGSSADGLAGRVEVLEDAVDTLLDAQVDILPLMLLSLCTWSHPRNQRQRMILPLVVNSHLYMRNLWKMPISACTI